MSVCIPRSLQSTFSVTVFSTKVGRFSRNWFSTSFSTNSVSNHVYVHNLASSYKFHVIETTKTCDRFFAVRRSRPYSVVGLDCWTANNNQVVGLLQLAFPDKECALVCLNKLGHIPGSLGSFLKDKRVLKCGVGIANDTTRLNEDYKLETKGVIELQHLAFRCGVTGSRSLRGLTELITGYRISNSTHQSNWEADLSVNVNRMHYAACYAIASLIIMEKLVSKEFSKSQGVIRNFLGDRWFKKESVLESDVGIAYMRTLCQGLVGAPMEETVRISRHFATALNKETSSSSGDRGSSKNWLTYSSPSSNDLVSGYRCRVIRSAKECDQFFTEKRSQPVSVVGMDCEYVSHKPTSLLQLAFPDKECVLVCLNKIKHIPESLALFLTDQSVLKCGVGIAEDAARLNVGYKVKTKGLIELQHIAFRCDVTGSRNLRGLTKILTGYQISKSARQSNWEADLSEKQIHYAASDAIASLNIMEKLVSKELSKGLSGTIRIICDRWGGNVSRSVLESDGGIACMHTLCQGLVGAPMEETKRISRMFAAAESAKNTTHSEDTTNKCYLCGRTLADNSESTKTKSS